MAEKDRKPETDRKYKKEDKRDETIATLDTSDETARLDVDLDESRLAVRPDAAERLDVFREGNLEGLQKEAEKFGPDATGQITDNLGKDIARHDGPGIAGMFKSGNEYGWHGTAKTDPLAGQPQVPDEKDGPDTPFRKNDPDLVSQTNASDLQGLLPNQFGGGTSAAQGDLGAAQQARVMGTPAYVNKVLTDSGVKAADKLAQDIEKQKEAEERKKIQEDLDRIRQEEEAKKQEQMKKEAEEKAKKEKEAEEKKKKEEEGKKKEDGKKKEGEKKEGDKEGEKDEETTYTTGEVESTPMIGTLESGPLLSDHDLLGHRVDPGDETVFEIDESQIDAVIKEHTTHGTQILTSAEELSATVDLSTPPTVPGSELENTGNPLDPDAPPPLPQGGSAIGPAPGGGGENEVVVPNAAGDAVAIDTGASNAPTVAGGTDFSGPPPGAEQAAPVPGGADLGDDPDDDGIPGPG